MGGIVMIVILVLLIVGIIICFICNVSKTSDEDREFRVWTSLALLFFALFLGMIINAITTPSIEDYIHGNVKMEIRQTIKNGEVIKQDTVYRKL